MANDLETMRERLREQLSDIEDETWNAGEKDDILHWAVRRLNQRLPRPLDHEVTATLVIALTAADYYYAIPASATHVLRVDLLDSEDNELGPLTSGWEIIGDLVAGTAKLHVSPQVVDSLEGSSVRLMASGRYGLPIMSASQTDAIPDDYVTLVLSLARVEAYERLIVDRVRFRQWQVANQVQNVSINELIQMRNNAEQMAEREWALLRRWQRPVPARI